MESERFDRIAMLVGGRDATPISRRLLAVAALAGIGLARGHEVDAAGCLATRKACRRNSQCCSGLCHRRTCRRVPGQGICTIRQDSCGVPGYACASSPNQAACECFVRLNGTAFCGASTGNCPNPSCQSDADCANETGNPGAVCIRSTGGNCCPTTITTTCKLPCPDPA
jgi:hypothetical protein